MLKKYSLSKKYGATLVDTLIGVLLFSIAVIAAMSMLSFTSSLYSLQDEDSVANTILNYVAEDVKAAADRNYNDTDLSLGNHSTDFTSGSKKPSELDKLNNGAISVTIIEEEVYLKKITIKLTWDSVTGNSQLQEIILYITDPQII